ncbi:hypothetical protein BB558_002446, partial [Smittium angustum]
MENNQKETFLPESNNTSGQNNELTSNNENSDILQYQIESIFSGLNSSLAELMELANVGYSERCPMSPDVPNTPVPLYEPKPPSYVTRNSSCITNSQRQTSENPNEDKSPLRTIESITNLASFRQGNIYLNKSDSLQKQTAGKPTSEYLKMNYTIFFLIALLAPFINSQNVKYIVVTVQKCKEYAISDISDVIYTSTTNENLLPSTDSSMNGDTSTNYYGCTDCETNTPVSQSTPSIAQPSYSADNCQTNDSGSIVCFTDTEITEQYNPIYYSSTDSSEIVSSLTLPSQTSNLPDKTSSQVISTNDCTTNTKGELECGLQPSTTTSTTSIYPHTQFSLPNDSSSILSFDTDDCTTNVYGGLECQKNLPSSETSNTIASPSIGNCSTNVYGGVECPSQSQISISPSYDSSLTTHSLPYSKSSSSSIIDDCTTNAYGDID